MAKVTDPINVGPLRLANRLVGASLLAVGVGERGRTPALFRGK